MVELLTTQEAALVAGVGPTAIKRWADNGELPCVRTGGGHRRFVRAELMAFLREQQRERPRDLDQWLERGDLGIQATLLVAREQEGSWHRVAARVGAGLVELGERWAAGTVTMIEEHVVSAALGRAIARVVESMPLPPGAPRALLVTAEGDDHTLGLSCVELCLREAGWATQWAGRATPADALAEWIDASEVAMVAASASQASKSRAKLARWLRVVEPVCRERDVRLVLGGQGAWPEAPEHAVRLHDFGALAELARGAR